MPLEPIYQWKLRKASTPLEPTMVFYNFRAGQLQMRWVCLQIQGGGGGGSYGLCPAFYIGLTWARRTQKKNNTLSVKDRLWLHSSIR
jgi:hypothetical protein